MSDNEHMRMIEIEGIKIEVDMRTAKKVESYRVGDRVKLLVKHYGDTYETKPGIIVGIDAFKNLPTIVICYIDNPLSDEGKVDFAYINAQSKDLEICPMCEDDVIPTKETIVSYFEHAERTMMRKVEDIRVRKAYFLRRYGLAFGVGAEEIAAATTCDEQ